LLMLLLTAILSTVAALASLKINKEWKGYFAAFLLLETGMLGVFAAGNMILFFLFFELTLVSAFLLVGKWGYEQKEKAAYHFLIFSGIGSGLLLIVMMTLQARLGTTDIQFLIENLPFKANGMDLDYDVQRWLLFGLLAAFLIKLPSFPFHSWMIKMHTQAPIPVVMLHAGVLLKVGGYGMIRFGVQLFPEQFQEIALWLAVLGVVNLLYGAFLAYIQTDMKKMIAYSSISHMGLVLMGLGALNEIGIQGAIFQLVSHGLITALLFFLIGIIVERTQTADITEIGGLSKLMPVGSGLLLISAMAMLGLPGLSGFISELMVFVGLFYSHRTLAIIGVIVLILAAAYALNITLKIIWGKIELPAKVEAAAITDLSIIEKITAFGLLLFIVVLGVAPNIVGNELQDFITSLVNGLGR